MATGTGNAGLRVGRKANAKGALGMTRRTAENRGCATDWDGERWFASWKEGECKRCSRDDPSNCGEPWMCDELGDWEEGHGEDEDEFRVIAVWRDNECGRCSRHETWRCDEEWKCHEYGEGSWECHDSGCECQSMRQLASAAKPAAKPARKGPRASRAARALQSSEWSGVNWQRPAPVFTAFEDVAIYLPEPRFQLMVGVEM